jgi:hypothetical protein
VTPGNPPAARADRTLRYTGGLQPKVPAGITSGTATATTVPGQIAILTAVNILARAHPEIILALPDLALLIPSPAGETTLIEACRKLADAANPGVAVSTATRMAPGILSIGIGHDAEAATIYAGGARWTARTSGTRPQPVTAEPSSALGAGLAVTLAAGYIFRTAIGLPAVADRGNSLWSLAPTSEPTGPAAFGPVAVGSAWLVGAGAVGSCLAWWLQFTGVDGAWTVIDGDVADDTNLNRCLGLFAAHTGAGGQEPVPKSDAVTALIPGAVSYPHWWDDWAAAGPEPPDVLIPVANDYGIRSAIAAYGHPATVHATTSRDWTAELHRHLPGQDGCIACRLPEHTPAFACATGAAQPAGHDPGRDAALPFLSAAAGILLLSGLLHLQHGHWHTHDRNHWRLWFDQTPHPVQSSRWLCSRTCSSTPTSAVRRTIHQATRWYPPADGPAGPGPS